MKVRAACHIHSDWSYDGAWSLEALAHEFSRWGYGILMMAEHDRGFNESSWRLYRAACARASSDKIFLLPGIEYSDKTNTVHVLVWGDVPFCGEGLATGQLLAFVKSANGVAVFAHPSRREAWKSFELEWANLLLGIELWNRKVDGWSPSKTALPMLRASGAIPFAAMDYHGRRQSFPLSMVLDLQDGINEDSILDCLRNGHCHAQVFGFAIQGNRLVRSLPFLSMGEHLRRYISHFEKKVRAKRVRR